MSETVFTVRNPGSAADCARDLTDYLLTHNLTVSCAESATCGLVAKYLTDRSGSSLWFWGGMATYSVQAKKKILGVAPSVLDDPAKGPVSAECAAMMADGIRKISGTDLALSVTGIAGPTGEEPEKPVGTVYLGFSSSFRKTETIRIFVPGAGREECREAFAACCMALALAYAQGRAIVDIARNWV